MGDAPDSREPAKRFDLLKKDFEIMQANVNSTLNEMRAEMAQRDAARSERDAARSERDATARWWQTAIPIAAIGIGFTVYGFLTAPH